MDADNGNVTLLLQKMAGGDSDAASKLLPLVYSELHRLAKGYMRRERPDHTLQPTALINEAYMRLVKQDIDWNSREHFIGFAANTMRRVLVDYARQHKAEQRGGGLHRVEMHDDLAISPDRLEEITMLDDALKRLEQQNARQAKVVELRYFGGLSVEEIATLLGIAPRSVKRDWSVARVWLYRELQGGKEPPPEA